MPHRGLTRKQYLVANAFEVCIALLAVFGAFSYFIWPRLNQDAAIQKALESWTPVWMAQYGIGGILMVYGLCRPRPRIELAGLSLFISAVAINTVAVIYVIGKLALIPTLTYAAIAAACIVRAVEIIRASSKPRPT